MTESIKRTHIIPAKDLVKPIANLMGLPHQGIRRMVVHLELNALAWAEVDYNAMDGGPNDESQRDEQVG